VKETAKSAKDTAVNMGEKAAEYVPGTEKVK